jgi:hypothetical protein
MRALAQSVVVAATDKAGARLPPTVLLQVSVTSAPIAFPSPPPAAHAQVLSPTA